MQNLTIAPVTRTLAASSPLSAPCLSQSFQTKFWWCSVIKTFACIRSPQYDWLMEGKSWLELLRYHNALVIIHLSFNWILLMIFGIQILKEICTICDGIIGLLTTFVCLDGLLKQSQEMTCKWRLTNLLRITSVVMPFVPGLQTWVTACSSRLSIYNHLL